jgi:hypothetical protein
MRLNVSNLPNASSEISCITQQSILQPNSKFLIQFTYSYTSIVRDHSYEPLSHISDIVVIMQQFNMILHSFGSRLSASTISATYSFTMKGQGNILQALYHFVQLCPLCRNLSLQCRKAVLYRCLSTQISVQYPVINK